MNTNEIITIIIACISVIGSLTSIFFAFHLKKNGSITKEEFEIKIKNETENIEKQIETLANSKKSANQSKTSGELIEDTDIKTKEDN